MAIIFKPRRGTLNKATNTLTGDNVLQAGEIFFEIPDAGEGKGAGKIKMGDGSTGYSSLPYFFNPADYAAASHNHTTAEITGFADAVGAVKVTNATTSDITNNIPVDPSSTSNMNIWITTT